jgi:hemolysin III
VLSCFALYLLIEKAIISFPAVNTNNNMNYLVSLSLFGCSLILLFLASTLYHNTSHSKSKARFKLYDHCAIYLLIAGTYTPLLAVTLAGKLGYSLLVIIWLLALSGIIFKVKFGNRFKKLSLATYLGMGFISIGLLGELYQALPIAAIQLLALGGVFYSVGVFFYVKKTVPYTHAIWHVFVMAGAYSHFLMIYRYV